MDDVIFDAKIITLIPIDKLKSATLKFSVSIKTSRLTKIYHYNSDQIKLYSIIKHLYEDNGYSYRRISDILVCEGYKSTRSNKPLLPNYIYSIYKKGKIRENRINRNFTPVIHNVRFYIN